MVIILDVGMKGCMLNSFEGRASRAPERSWLAWEGHNVYHDIFSFLHCFRFFFFPSSFA